MKRIFTILFFLSLSVVTSLAQTDAQTPQASVDNTEQAQPAESASDNTDDLWQRAWAFRARREWA